MHSIEGIIDLAKKMFLSYLAYGCYNFSSLLVMLTGPCHPQFLLGGVSFLSTTLSTVSLFYCAVSPK